MSKLHLMAGEQDGRVHEVDWTEDTRPEIWYQPTIKSEHDLKHYSGPNIATVVDALSTLAYVYRETIVKSYSTGQTYLEFQYWHDPKQDKQSVEIPEE